MGREGTSRIGRWSWVVVACLAATLVATATGQVDDLAGADAAATDETGDQFVYAPEANVCTSTEESGESSGILSVGEHLWDEIRVPCWLGLDLNCRNGYLINLGDVFAGQEGTSVYLYPDAYFDNQECGYADSAGEIPAGWNGFYAYVGDGLAMRIGATTARGVGVQLEVYEFTSTDCSTGYTTRWWTDPGDPSDPVYGSYQCCWVDPTAGGGYRPMTGYGIGYCETGGDTDPGGASSHPWCHMPDVWISRPPGGTGYRSYLYRISTKVCSNPACNSGCSSTAYQTGCFHVNWR